MPYTATNRLDIIGSQVVSAGLTIGEVAQGSEATVGLRVLVANQTERLVVDNTGTTISSGDLSLSAGKVSASTFSIPSGLTGATAASRYVGATATGAPVGGSFVVGDWVISQAGSIYIYTSQGWTQVSGGGGGGGVGTTTNALTIGSGLTGSTSLTFDGSNPNTISLNVANSNTWTSTQTFSSGFVANAVYVTAIENPTLDIGGMSGGLPLVSNDGYDKGITFRWHDGLSSKQGFFGFQRSTQNLIYVPDATIINGIVSGTQGTVVGVNPITQGQISLSSENAWTAQQIFNNGIRITGNNAASPSPGITYNTIIPNDISGKFDGVKSVFSLMENQTSITSIVDSKDLQLFVNGKRLIPYYETIVYPWICEFDSFSGYRVRDGKVIIYNAPNYGEQAYMAIEKISISRTRRRYPFNSCKIVLGD